MRNITILFVLMVAMVINAEASNKNGISCYNNFSSYKLKHTKGFAFASHASFSSRPSHSAKKH